VIAAAGVPNLVRGNWLKPGAIVIDVGTNPIEVTIRLLIYFAYFWSLLSIIARLVAFCAKWI